MSVGGMVSGRAWKDMGRARWQNAKERRWRAAWRDRFQHGCTDGSSDGLTTPEHSPDFGRQRKREEDTDGGTDTEKERA